MTDNMSRVLWTLTELEKPAGTPVGKPVLIESNRDDPDFAEKVRAGAPYVPDEGDLYIDSFTAGQTVIVPEDGILRSKPLPRRFYTPVQFYDSRRAEAASKP